MHQGVADQIDLFVVARGLAKRGDHDLVPAARNHGQPAVALADRHHALVDERGRVLVVGHGSVERFGPTDDHKDFALRPSDDGHPVANRVVDATVLVDDSRRGKRVVLGGLRPRDIAEFRRDGAVPVNRRYEGTKPQRGRHLLDAQ